MKTETLIDDKYFPDPRVSLMLIKLDRIADLHPQHSADINSAIHEIESTHKRLAIEKQEFLSFVISSRKREIFKDKIIVAITVLSALSAATICYLQL